MKRLFTNQKLSARLGSGSNSNRVLSLLLSFALLISMMPQMLLFPVRSVETEQGSDGDTNELQSSNQWSYDYETLKITLNDKEISVLELYTHEKIQIQSDGLSGEADYQWQIQHPEKDDVWVDIFDATNQTLSVTAALINNVLRPDGTAKLRCRAYTEDYAYISNPVTVTLLFEQNTDIATLSSALGDNDIVMLADSDSTSEFVTVMIHYVLYSYQEDANGNFAEVNMGDAFTSYVATLKSETDLTTSVHCPTIVGYEPELTNITVGGVEQSITADDFNATDNIVNISLTNVISDVVYTVEYHPTEVTYKVQYFFQNIYDDMYVEDSSIKPTVYATGKTGMRPSLDHVHAVIPGFTSLYYEPEIIAADGSTIFHVYYERNYYLMEFDCNEGFGTDTIYVRYGTYISVPDPVRSGYDFDGWDLVGSDNPDDLFLLGSYNSDTNRYSGDGAVNVLPSTMPRYHSAYKALWSHTDTTYTLAYWIVASDGSKTYLGGRVESATSGATVFGKDDLGIGEGTGAVCRYHSHSEACYTCDQTEHTHRVDLCTLDCGHTHSVAECCDGYQTGNLSSWDLGAIQSIGDGEPESGFVYVISSSWDTNEYYYLYVENTWYKLINNEQWVVGEQLGDTGTDTSSGWGTVYAKKYNAKLECDHVHDSSCCTSTEHTHTDACLGCGMTEHVHTSDCYHDARNLEFLSAESAIVEGDGSTIVNIYYQYKEYTLKFYYAATEGGTESDADGDAATYDSIKIVGGSTYYFGNSKGPNTSNDETLLTNMYNTASEWGAVDELPLLNEKGEARNYTKGQLQVGDVTYHFISFTARYGDNISDMWPCDVFQSVTRTDKDDKNGWSGTEAFVSAWNGEHHVRYSRNPNETIKGVYEILDDELLFHSDYADETEVSFLCFWENGANIAWSVPELYRYNIYLEVYIGQDLTGLTTVTKNDGKTYYLLDYYDTCDNSNPGEQTQPALTGYTAKTFDSQSHDGYSYYQVKDSDPAIFYEYNVLDDYDTQLYSEAYELNFYYTRSSHTLIFWNHNDYLMSGQGVSLQYGAPLRKYAEGVGEHKGANALVLENYPSGMEPGAYEFAGWYTTADFLPGTEMDWDTVMPDSDLTVYAYWKPKERNIYFYLTYDNMVSHAADPDGDYTWDTTKIDGTAVTYPIVVEHGEILGTTYYFTPTRTEDADHDGVYDYTFVGWFYIDDTGKKRFAPDSMEVKQDLRLFAEWQSGIDTQYNVTYVLDADSVIGDVFYPAGTPIAKSTTGHLTAGRTKTFTAKVGVELLADFQSLSLFPTVNTHSILMVEGGTENNAYEFRYVYDAEVWYKVRYVDKITGDELHTAKVSMSTQAIITEKFIPISGYVPESYYIRKVLASDGNNGSEANVSELNEIIFYYSPDTVHGLYLIEYYTENLDSTDPTDLDNYSFGQSIVGSDDLLDANGDPMRISAPDEPDKFNGFTLAYYTITTYTAREVTDDNGNQTTVYDAVTTDPIVYNPDNLPSGVLSAGGLEIKVYYQRNSYKYNVKFVEYGNPDNVLGYGKSNDDTVYDKDQNLLAKFGSTIEYDAPDTISVSEITYNFYATSEKPQTQKMEIRANDEENVMVFYYKAKETKIFYEAVCHVAGASDFGVVSLNFESAATANSISGSNATAGIGFRFVGWFSDPSCEVAVDPSWRYIPGAASGLDMQDKSGTKLRPAGLNPALDEVTYYALFEPIFSSLTIHNAVNIPSEDTFLFRVQGTGKTSYIDIMISITGSDSVIVEQLPIGEYTVTLLTDWSWLHIADTASHSISLGDTQQETHFENTFYASGWLNGECIMINTFEGVYIVEAP